MQKLAVDAEVDAEDVKSPHAVEAFTTRADV
jgi:hypothetical protein